MIGISISMRKPRCGDFTQVDPGKTVDLTIGVIVVLMTNSGEKPLYIKWRI